MNKVIIIHDISLELTDKIGVFPMRLSVKGDGTSAYAKLAIIPPKSKCVVFSIDGSFAASGEDSINKDQRISDKVYIIWSVWYREQKFKAI